MSYRRHRNWAKNDEGDLIRIKRHIRQCFGIDYRRIKLDWFLLIPKDNPEKCQHCEYITRQQAESRRYIVHHPDIIILQPDSAKKIMCVVELDGSIHETHIVQRRDARRNMHYDEAGIPCIILDDAEKKTNMEYLNTQLAKMFS